jgi:hypothetical protein
MDQQERKLWCDTYVAILKQNVALENRVDGVDGERDDSRYDATLEADNAVRSFRSACNHGVDK